MDTASSVSPWSINLLEHYSKGAFLGDGTYGVVHEGVWITAYIVLFIFYIVSSMYDESLSSCSFFASPLTAVTPPAINQFLVKKKETARLNTFD